jgi:hypothetical protein
MFTTKVKKTGLCEEYETCPRRQVVEFVLDFGKEKDHCNGEMKKMTQE